MSQPSAKVIADSISPEGVRLTTMQVTFHRWVLAEMNTHRVLSKNSASSRAIPVHKMLSRIRETPAHPVVWASEQKGMQGGQELSRSDQIAAQALWDNARESALTTVECLTDLGVHKSIANRLIEPHALHTAVITGTAWENFFEQRCSPLAQPEIRVAAEAMRAAYEASRPLNVDEGDWHLPYIDSDTIDEVAGEIDKPGDYATLAKISAARCARVSYLTQDGKRDIEADLALYERLTSAQPKHWSPLEHVATPWAANHQGSGPGFFLNGDRGEWVQVNVQHLPRVGNLLRWRSLRTTVEATHGERTYR